MPASIDTFTLFVCANANQVKLLAPVAEQLVSHGRGVLMLSLDCYYAQSARAELAQGNLPWCEFPGNNCRGRFYDSPDQRPMFIAEAIVETMALFRALPGVECLVLGHDVELLEQLLIREAERRGIPTVRVQDGRDFGIEIKVHTGFERSRFPFDGGCDLNLTWAEGTIGRLRQRGISGAINAVGNLRLDRLENWQGYQRTPPPWDVLLCLQCFCRHQVMTLQQELSMYERLIRQFLERSEVRLRVKPHPHQQHLDSYRELIAAYGARVTLLEEGDSIDAIRSADLVAAISSTVLTESTLMGVPSMSLPHLMIPDSRVFVEQEQAFLRALSSDSFPHDTWYQVTPREKSISEEGGVIDGLAAKRAADAVERLITARSKPKRAALPRVSVLLIYDQGVALAAVRAILRSELADFELVFVDTSLHGETSNELLQKISDPRLRIIPLAGASIGASINRGLEECRAEFVLRLAKHCSTFPNWLEQMSDGLEQNSSAHAALSWSRLRNSVGFLSDMRLLAPGIRPEEVLALEDSDRILQSYAFRKTHAPKAVETEPQAERLFFSSLFTDHRDSRQLTIVPQCLYTTAFDERTVRNIALTPAQSPIRIWRPDTESETLSPPVAITSKAPNRCSVLCFGLRDERRIERIEAILGSQTLVRDAIEVIALDCEQASVSDSLSQLVEKYSGTVVLKNHCGSDSSQFAEALKIASSDVIVLLGESIEPEADFLEQHFEAHSRTESADVIVGRLSAADNSSLILQSLFGIGYFGLTSRSNGVQERDVFSTENVSWKATVTELVLEVLELGLETRWGVDLAISTLLDSAKTTIDYHPDSVSRLDRKMEVRDFIIEDIERKRDLLRLMNRDPAYIERFLNTPTITQEQLVNWVDEVKETSGQISPALIEIERTCQEIKSSPTAAAAAEIVAALGEALTYISNFLLRREIVRHYTNVDKLAPIHFGQDEY